MSKNYAYLNTRKKEAGIGLPIMIAIIAIALAGSGASYVVIKNNAKKAAKEHEKAMMEVDQKLKDKIMERSAMGETKMHKTLVIPLKAQNNSGQDGQALIEDAGGKAKVTVKLAKAPTNIDQPAHIHIGACPNPGAVKYPLTNVKNGNSVTQLEISVDEILKNLPFAVNVHKSTAEVKTYVSCGDVKAEMIKKGDAMMEKDNMVKDDAMMKDSEKMMEGGMMKYEGEVLAGKSAKLYDFKKSDYDAALKSGNLVVLYFYANWCPICKAEVPMLYSAFNELSSDKVVGFRVNYNDNETDSDEVALAREFGVAYQHTKVFLKNGARVLKSPETWTKERYLDEISKAL